MTTPTTADRRRAWIRCVAVAVVASVCACAEPAERDDVRLPGEFEAVQELVVGWDTEMELFFVDLVASAAGYVPVTVAVGDTSAVEDVEAVLSDFGVHEGDVRVVDTPIESIWVRDFGPVVVQRGDGGREVVDLSYPRSEIDDAFASEAARDLLGMRAIEASLALDGGNLLSDGAGRCVVTELALQPQLPGGRHELEGRMRDLFGCHALSIVPRMYLEETGHVDMFVMLPAPGEALVGEFDVADDPDNAALLDEVAALLELDGFEVERIPMGANGDGVFRSYTNSLAVNGAVLVPIYPEEPLYQDRALSIIARAYPGREVIPVIATDAIALGGALHCTAMAISATTTYQGRFER